MYFFPEPLSRNPKVPAPRKRAVIRVLDVMGRIAALPLLPWLRRTTPPLPSQPRFLLIRTDGIGDFLMTMHLFPALRKAYPEARIDLLCNRWSKSIAELYAGDLDEILTMGADNVHPRVMWNLISRLRAGRYDAAVDLRGDFRNAILCWLSGAPRRYGYAYSGYDFLLTHALPAEGLHQVEETVEMGKALGAPLRPELHLPIPEENRALIDTWLEAQPRDDEKPLIAFHLSVTRPAKLWPLERFQEVARYLQERHDAQIVALGGKEDRAETEAFSAGLPHPALNAAGEMSLAQTAALLERCRLFVGLDSGPAHLSAAVHCPTVVLFGATDPQIFRPWGDHCRVVKATRPCHSRCDQVACAVPEQHCMKTVTVDRVCSTASELLALYPTEASHREKDSVPCA